MQDIEIQRKNRRRTQLTLYHYHDETQPEAAAIEEAVDEAMSAMQFSGSLHPTRVMNNRKMT